MLTLSIPPKRDPIARFTLLAAVAIIVGAWLIGTAQPDAAAAQAQPDPIIIFQPTPALPTAAPDAPALTLAAPTPEPQVIYVPGPKPEPQVIYVQVAPEQAGQPADPNILPPIEAQPAYDPTLHPDEAAQALATAYQSDPVLVCPCGPDLSKRQWTERDYAYSRARTR